MALTIGVRFRENGKVYDVDYTIFGMSATFDYPLALADLESMLYGN